MRQNQQTGPLLATMALPSLRSRLLRLLGLCSICSLLLTACADISTITASQVCQTPATDSDWRVSTAVDAGFDPAALCKSLTEAAQGKVSVHAVLVERHGQLVAELYRPGPDRSIKTLYGLWPPFKFDTAFDAQTLHDVRSVSKSIVGLLYGIGLHENWAPALDTPVLSLYPELANLRNPQRDAITVRHLLSMRSGLVWHEWARGAIDSDETPLYWKTQTAHYLFDRDQAALAGSTFNYSGGNTATLADILVRQSHQTLTELARTRLFEPLNITQWEWISDLHDRPLAFSGLRMRPRDMLKIGRLVNNHGQWHGRQIVPASWMNEATRAQIDTNITLFSLNDQPEGYGYQWWTGHVMWQGRALTWASAVGNGGQKIFVVPELDLSIVLTAGDYGSAQIQRDESNLLAALVASVITR